jgi:periplasmic divalent cation tolerance protein
MSVQLVYATFPDRDSLEAIAPALLEERLAACFTCWEAGTQYRWEGEIVADEETLALFKTRPEHVDDLVARLEDEHPYDVPCIVPLSGEDANEAYADWIRAETR